MSENTPTQPHGPPLDVNTLYLLGQIDAKVTHLLASQSTLYERLEKHDERISRVEKGHWKMAGIATAIPTLIAAAGLVLAYLGGKQ